jgi:hypothetical protein
MGTRVPKYPDFLRQVFNVVLAEHQSDVDSRTANESRKLVWAAENKYGFSSFDVDDPRENLKRYFESNDFVDLVKLLKSKGRVLEVLLNRIKEYYGDELYEIARRRVEEALKEDEI